MKIRPQQGKTNPSHQLVRQLAGEGFSYALIRRQTGYSTSWIGQICRKGNCSPSSYRNGESLKAQQVLARMERAIDTCRLLRGLPALYDKRRRTA